MQKIEENGFAELSTEEAMNVDGGVGAIATFAAGFVACAVVDGTVKHYTGKTCGDWVAKGIDWFVKEYV